MVRPQMQKESKAMKLQTLAFALQLIVAVALIVNIIHHW